MTSHSALGFPISYPNPRRVAKRFSPAVTVECEQFHHEFHGTVSVFTSPCTCTRFETLPPSPVAYTLQQRRTCCAITDLALVRFVWGAVLNLTNKWTCEVGLGRTDRASHEQTDAHTATPGPVRVDSSRRASCIVHFTVVLYTPTLRPRRQNTSSSVVLGVLRSGMKPFTPISRRAEKLTDPLGFAHSGSARLYEYT